MAVRRTSTKPPTFRNRAEAVAWWTSYAVAHFGCDQDKSRQHAERIVSRAEERRITTSKPLTASRNAPEL
jgi:hypothetical protein